MKHFKIYPDKNLYFHIRYSLKNTKCYLLTRYEVVQYYNELWC